jgi:hypothetical protein
LNFNSRKYVIEFLNNSKAAIKNVLSLKKNTYYSNFNGKITLTKQLPSHFEFRQHSRGWNRQLVAAGKNPKYV